MPASAAFPVVAEDNNFAPRGVYLWLESRAELTNRYDENDGVSKLAFKTMA